MLILDLEVEKLEEELSEIFSGFPSKEHIKKICRPGSGKERTCRFLVMESLKGFRCAKASSLRETLDEKVTKGEISAKGDNCEGLLGFIIEQQEKLKGKTVTYREYMPSFSANGVLRRIEVRGELVYIEADWKYSGVEEKYYNVNYLEISIIGNSITFAVSGLGAFVGETIIFF